MAVREETAHIRLTTKETERLSDSLLFALSFLQEFALEQNRGEIETLMMFVGRLAVSANGSRSCGRNDGQASR